MKRYDPRWQLEVDQRLTYRKHANLPLRALTSCTCSLAIKPGLILSPFSRSVPAQSLLPYSRDTSQSSQTPALRPPLLPPAPCCPVGSRACTYVCALVALSRPGSSIIYRKTPMYGLTVRRRDTYSDAGAQTFTIRALLRAGLRHCAVPCPTQRGDRGPGKQERGPANRARHLHKSWVVHAHDAEIPPQLLALVVARPDGSLTWVSILIQLVHPLAPRLCLDVPGAVR